MKKGERSNEGTSVLPKDFSKNERVAFVALACVLVAALCVYSTNHAVSASFFYAVAALYSYGVAIVLYWSHRYGPLPAWQQEHRALSSLFLACASLFCGFVVELLTVVGLPTMSVFDLSAWSVRRLAIFSCVSFAVISFARWLYVTKPWRSDGVFRDFARTFLVLCASALLLLLFSFVSGVGFGDYADSNAKSVFLALCVLVIVVACVVFVKKRYPNVVAALYVVIAVFMGGFICLASPPVTGISWDDQIHYSNTLGLSYLGEGEFTDADIDLLAVSWVPDGVFQFDEMEETVSRLNSKYSQAVEEGDTHTFSSFSSPMTGSSIASIQTVGYIPSAIGLWLARLMGLSFTGMVTMGCLVSLLFYVTCMLLSICIAPYKKVLFAVIGLIPTGLYMAAHYSYDPWIIALVALSVSMFLRLLHSPKNYFDIRLAMVPLAVFVLAICPKAIYFPLLGLFLLVPKQKYRTLKERRLYISIVVLIGVFLVASFVLPLLFTPSVQAGDSRGGAGVSAVGQINYIIHNPVEFAKTLLWFLLGYIAPASSDGYIVHYAYSGILTAVIPFIACCGFLVLLLTAIFGSDEIASLEKAPRGIVAALVFITVALIATSLYVSYNPVGADGIGGCQPRYLLPLLIAVFLLVNIKKLPRVSAPVLSLGCMAPMGVLLLLCNGCLIV